MSLGIGARARIEIQDNETVIYKYYGYNWNEPNFKEDNRIYDGYIIIPKSCFVEPEIHKKMKKMPSGKRKLVIKRVPVDVDYEKMVKDGLIEIHNCTNTWKTNKDNVDYTALHLLFILFNEYQETGEIPEYLSYFK